MPGGLLWFRLRGLLPKSPKIFCQDASIAICRGISKWSSWDKHDGPKVQHGGNYHDPRLSVNIPIFPESYPHDFPKTIPYQWALVEFEFTMTLKVMEGNISLNVNMGSNSQVLHEKMRGSVGRWWTALRQLQDVSYWAEDGYSAIWRAPSAGVWCGL